jgi:hypothetical protein
MWFNARYFFLTKDIYIAKEPIYIRQTQQTELKQTDAKQYCNSHCKCWGSCWGSSVIKASRNIYTRDQLC